MSRVRVPEGALDSTVFADMDAAGTVLFLFPDTMDGRIYLYALSVLQSGKDFHSNLPAPTGERTTMNESKSGAFGIPERRSPAAMGLSQ